MADHIEHARIDEFYLKSWKSPKQMGEPSAQGKLHTRTVKTKTSRGRKPAPNRSTTEIERENAILVKHKKMY